MFRSTISVKKAALGAALVGATLTGGAVGAALITPASAQTPTTATTAASGTASTAAPSGTPGDHTGTPRDPHLGGHQANGITETLLTGDNLAKATAAANAAVPGGTIQRAENDAEGATYEVHMLDKSGSQVTVKLDGSFKVTTVEQGR